jgi:anti-sigma regulatory factor (Ser/Thr protein kinase)
MPRDVRCRVEADESSAIVGLTGVLDPARTDAVRDALLARLWQRPGPVIVDLSGVRIVGPDARAVVDEVHRTVADWPAAGLLVFDPTAAPGSGTHEPAGTPDGTHEPAGTPDGTLDPAAAPVYPSLDEAQAALVAAPLTAVLNADLPAVATVAGEARGLVTDGCDRWGVPDLAEPARIAVTEMVNNVVAHAGTPMTVRVAPGDGALRLAVRDHSARGPAYTGLAPLNSAGGRGLLLIDAVSRRWGSTPLPDGKVVWCVLHAEDETAARE